MNFSSLRDNLSLGVAGIAEGTNANTIRTTAAINYTINGRAFTKAATDNLPFSAGHTALAARQTCAFFVMLDAAGNVTTAQSAVAPAPSSAVYVAGAWEWPNPESTCVIGALVVRTDGAATFTPNTTDLGSADVVETAVHVALDYSKPITY